MYKNIILSCGCEKEFINNKLIWIYCDEHDEDNIETEKPIIKRYRKKEMDYI